LTVGLLDVVAHVGYNIVSAITRFRAMTINSVVRARVSEDLKQQATVVLAEMGLTVSDAVRILLTKVAKERAFPFDLTPNALTADTMRKSKRGEDVHYAEDADELFKDLGI
jgi:DNA-damage-inducible protein J